MSTIIKTSPAVANKPTGKLYLVGNQSNLVHNTWTLVVLDTISDGFVDGIEDTTLHRITPGVAGFYDVKGQVTLFNLVADKGYLIRVRDNTGTSRVEIQSQASIAGYLTILFSCHLWLSAANHISLLARSDAGVDTVDIRGTEKYTFLSMQRVR